MAEGLYTWTRQCTKQTQDRQTASIKWRGGGERGINHRLIYLIHEFEFVHHVPLTVADNLLQIVGEHLAANVNALALLLAVITKVEIA